MPITYIKSILFRLKSVDRNYVAFHSASNVYVTCIYYCAIITERKFVCRDIDTQTADLKVNSRDVDKSSRHIQDSRPPNYILSQSVQRTVKGGPAISKGPKRRSSVDFLTVPLKREDATVILGKEESLKKNSSQSNAELSGHKSRSHSRRRDIQRRARSSDDTSKSVIFISIPSYSCSHLTSVVHSLI